MIYPSIAPEGYAALTRDMPFLGRVTCDQTRLEAGSWQEIVLTIEIGASGLADGATLKATFKFYSDWALFQTSDPGAANYLTAEYQARPLLPGEEPATVQALSCRFDQKGHERPFQKAVIVDVVDGYLNAGDRITLRLGDRRFGGPGTRIQTFVESGFRFRCYIDPLGTSRYAAIPGDVSLDIVPGPVHRLAVTTPRLIRPGAACPIFVRAEDEWGNTCAGLGREVRLTAALAGQPTIHRVRSLPEAGWATVRIDDVPTAGAGEMALEASLLGDGPAHTAEAFVTLDEACPTERMFFADLHVHSDDTVGTNDTTYNLGYGRDVAGLDVLGYTANDFNITAESWARAVDIIEQLNEPSLFVCYPGTEWCGNSAAGGDHNVVFLRGGTAGFPNAADGRTARSVEWNETMGGQGLTPGVWPLDRLYEAYEHDPEGHLLIPHVGGRRCNLGWHHPELERLVEIGSTWGHFPWLMTDALARGYRVGASANSDEHRGRCGGGVPGTAVFGTKGGLTGVIADTLDRANVGAALRARRTWATTGERSVALLSSGAAQQGDEIESVAPVPVEWRILNDTGWEWVAAFDQEKCLWERDLITEAGLSARRIRLSWGGARIKDRYRSALWQGRLTLRNATILGFRTIGFDHREEVAWREGANALCFRSDTSGDTDGVELDIANLTGCTLELSGSIGGYTKVGDPRVPTPFAHCPSFDWQTDGATLIAERRLRRDLPGVDMALTLERLSDAPLPRDLSGRFDVDPVNGPHGFRPVYLRARGARADSVMTSPLFIRRA